MAGMEMFLVRPHEGAPADANEAIADHAARHGGLILMATAGNSLIIGMPPGSKDVLASHPHVAFVGGVHLEQQGKGARALQQQFATNAARQLLAQQSAAGTGNPSDRRA